MSAADTAREVLAAVKPADACAWTTTREFVDVVSAAEEACIANAPTLARAMLRVEALADRLDDGHLRHLIRTTLNGDDHE